MKALFPYALLFCCFALLSSCVSKKRYNEMVASQQQIQQTLDETQRNLRECRDETASLRSNLTAREATLQERDRTIASLQDQLTDSKNTNAALLERMSDLSVISKAGAESIQKSLESINQQSQYIKELSNKIQTRDSANLVLVMNLKRSLDDINDEDVEVQVRGGVVYVSLSDKMLYKSGSADILPRAQEVLGKVAKIVNDQKDLTVMVEGHTDNVPINTSCMTDNWDLSTKRATAVVRVLQSRYGVAPSRLVAAGRSEYVPKTTNDTAEGRSTNRRTDIIILPSLEQFFKLNEIPAEAMDGN